MACEELDAKPATAEHPQVLTMESLLMAITQDLPQDEVLTWFVPAAIGRNGGDPPVAMMVESAMGRVLVVEDHRGRAWLVTADKVDAHPALVELRSDDDAWAQYERCLGIIDADGSLREAARFAH